MKNTFKKVKDSFSDELNQEGDIWRILRKGSLVDFIRLSFYKYQIDKDEKHLRDVFNHCMKIKLLTRIKAIEVKGSLEDIAKRFNKQHEFVLNPYDIIYNELEPGFENYKSGNLYDLNEKIQYIKVINELEFDSYVDDIFEEIIGITYNILGEE